ncbi:hypothetical protein [Candidatus Binatus sp.]|uniref:hypothetical protein n=1 Tax=Candidatus Binatus sp. TaxID=2811406 RepID=UPI003CAB3E1F
MDSLIGDFLIVAVYLGICGLIAYGLSSSDQQTEGPEKQAQASDAAEQGAAIGGLASDFIADQPPAKNDTENADKPLKSPREYFQRDIRKPRFWIEIFALGAVVVYTCIMYTSNELTRQNFEASERPYISLGRADGVMAEFAESKDPNGKAGLKIYIKNAGRLPALHVSPSVTALTIPPITPATHYGPAAFVRSRNKTDGSYQELGGDTVAGDSTYVFFVPDVLPETVVNKLKTINNGTLFMVRGEIPYCDSLGEAFCKQFTLYWQSDPLATFGSIGLEDCWFYAGNNARPSKNPNIENLPPCESPQEYEQRQKQFAAPSK